MLLHTFDLLLSVTDGHQTAVIGGG